jgi:hypothetical protein
VAGVQDESRQHWPLPFFQVSPAALRQLWISWAPAKDAKANAANPIAILFKLITVFPFRDQSSEALRDNKTYALGAMH